MKPSTSRARTKKACLRSSSRRPGTFIKTYRNKISKRSIKRLARRGGVRRISDLVYKEIGDLLNVFLTRLIAGSIAYCEYSKRKTIMADDVIRSVKNCGQRLYGFGEPPLPDSVRRKARVTTGTNSLITESIERTVSGNSEESFERDETTLNVACTGLNDDNSMQTSVNTEDTERIIANSEINVESGERISKNSGWNEGNNRIIRNSVNTVDTGRIIANSETNLENGERIIKNSGLNEENIRIIRNSVNTVDTGRIIANSEINVENGESISKNSGLNEGNNRIIRNSVNTIDTGRITANSETNLENDERIIKNSGLNKENNHIIRNSEIIEGYVEVTQNSKRNEENEEILCISDTRTTGNAEIRKNSKRNEENEEIICISDTRTTGNPEIMRNSKSNAGRLFKKFNQADRRIERTEVTNIENSKISMSLHNQEIITALSSLNDVNQMLLITLDDSD